MDQDTNQSSEQEIAPGAGLQESNVQQETPEQPQVQEKSQDTSWIKQLRRDRDDAIRKSKMQEELLEKILAQQAQMQQPQPSNEEDFIQEIQKEEYVPGDKVAKALKKMEEKMAKQTAELEKKYAAKAYQDSISDLKREYPDLEDVVNPETLSIVKEKNPRLAKTWQGLDDYSIYVQAYPYLKNSGLLDNVPNAKQVKEVEKKLEKNAKTVQSPLAYEKRPIAQAFDSNRLSEEQKRSLWEETQQYARYVSSVPQIS